MSLRYTENKLGTLANQLVVLDAFARLPALSAVNLTGLSLAKYSTFENAHNSTTPIISTAKLFYAEDLTNSTVLYAASGTANFTNRIAWLCRKPNSTNYTTVTDLLRVSTSTIRNFTMTGSALTGSEIGIIIKRNAGVQSTSGTTSTTFYEYKTGFLSQVSSPYTGNDTIQTSINLGLTQTINSLKEFPLQSNMRNGDAFLWDATNKRFFAEPTFDLYSRINVYTLSDSNTTYNIDDTTLPNYRRRACYLIAANVTNLNIKLPNANNREGTLVWISARTSNSNITITSNHNIMYDGALNPTITLGGSTQSDLRRCFFCDGTQWYYIGK
ncbi:hypothetical protein UFOVP724_107 [uncultured Caudovirales phage]|uniref:Uncharacterized protein n=1 Tax=uncultured Caudovirales phage TaxID=2100421 RepID=A0A6J5NMS7_9CAUD|nr:hypothetical protein UFOVP724_107 [uncultured Caudovirales phage]